ncbi:CYFIP-related Rac1 interactor B-like [Patiria miniata]|uniref:CYRIA/CYRIB Rac1 binding domain-containing protein n=1 Tax=Patiria miniata TaxID=46514 RepID=A0A914A0Z6_PATMI|nr:CYFIP-related Rac1 interactor B-like [Patiria miniata]
MGNLLLKLRGPQDDDPQIFIDFEKAEPKENEEELYNMAEDVLREADEILKDLQHYGGAGESIRAAICNPRNEELQQKAWADVCPLVARLKRYFEYSQKIEKALRPLLQELCTDVDMKPAEHLDSHQALAKQFAKILHFTLKFDDLKMTNPSIQNDFSYYRRTLSRIKMQDTDQGQNRTFAVNNEMANRMSLFLAEACPMLKVLSDSTTKFVTECKQVPLENTTDVLSTMVSVCKLMIARSEHFSRFQNEDTSLFCMRIMVGLIILYDHVHPVGAFDKKSSIDVKSCIKVLKDQNPNEFENLMNALRYNSKHFNDESTPYSTRALLT